MSVRVFSVSSLALRRCASFLDCLSASERENSFFSRRARTHRKKIIVTVVGEKKNHSVFLQIEVSHLLIILSLINLLKGINTLAGKHRPSVICSSLLSYDRLSSMKSYEDESLVVL
jgi:hypothetical protein